METHDDGVDSTSGERQKKVVGRPWPKGVSGNPGGRRKKLDELDRAIAEHNWPKVPGILDALHQMALTGDVAAALGWLDRVVGKARTRAELAAVIDAVVVLHEADRPEDVRALAMRALAIDCATLLEEARTRILTDAEQARLVAVARVTAPSRADETDPTAGASDAEIIAEARRALAAVEVPAHVVDESTPEPPEGANPGG
jgi:hypothetical protein